MSSRAGWGIEGWKKSFHRTKQSMMVKMGKAEKTVDVVFNSELERFTQRKNQMEKLSKRIDKFERAVKDLSSCQAELCESINSLYEGHCTLYGAVMTYQKITGEVDALRVAFEELIERDVRAPIAEYLGQYSLVQSRINERGRRLNDMDRYKTDLAKAMHKGEVESKLCMIREKVDIVAHAYAEINAELLRDIPRLIEDRHLFFDPLFASIADAQVAFYEQASRVMTQMGGEFDGVDRHGYREHQRVITEVDASSYARPVLTMGGAGYSGSGGGHQDEGTYPSQPQLGMSAPGPLQLTDGSTAGIASGHLSQPTLGGYQPPVSAGLSQPVLGMGAPLQPGIAPVGGLGAGGLTAEQQLAQLQQQQLLQQQQFQLQQQQLLQQQAQQQAAQQQAAAAAVAVPMAAASLMPGSGAFAMPATPAPAPPVVAAAAPAMSIKAKALYPFAGQDGTELTFNFGDIITIVGKNGDWWEGELNGKRGLLPANYVQEV
eukprot:TRINITY_DN468_c1_g1_i12.p1 TRINITY_DN468_c1_g1~~TRINITY_DN468_c1_g1_i12.p1  ORF type:complete len:489 (+),score=132.63 TRINITY_DN468_c1_g1_i12:152-1618(+)